MRYRLLESKDIYIPNHSLIIWQNHKKIKNIGELLKID